MMFQETQVYCFICFSICNRHSNLIMQHTILAILSARSSTYLCKLEALLFSEFMKIVSIKFTNIQLDFHIIFVISVD